MGAVEGDVDMEENFKVMMNHEEDLAGTEFEDAEAVAEAENEMEVAAEHIRLPIRSASEHATTSMAHEAQNNPVIDINTHAPTPSLQIIPPAKDEQATAAAPKLRRPKSTQFKKGGAFHAQQFAKSLGKGGAKARPSMLNIDWAQTEEDKKS